MIFQVGGALGAYEAGVYRVLYDWIYKNLEEDSEGKDENLFDVISGTSIGALNGAIILSHILEKRKADPNRSQKLHHYWHGSAQALEDFWNDMAGRNFLRDWYDLSFWPWDFFHSSTEIMKNSWENILDTTEESVPSQWKAINPLVQEWFDLLHFGTEAGDIPAKTEAARRYWTTRTFGSPNVAAAIPRYDFKFWDTFGFKFRGEQRRIPFYSGNPNYSLKESCRGYILDPLKTDPLYENKVPRLLLVTVDVESGDTISFDSSKTRTMYDEYDEYNYQLDQDKNKLNEDYNHLITYPNGIRWEELSTTFSMLDLYRYASLEDKSLAHDESEVKRTYWDGGMSSNTPLRELVDSHKKYWKKNNWR